MGGSGAALGSRPNGRRCIAQLIYRVQSSERGERMERKQASDFHPEVLTLFDQYEQGLIDRRGFLEKAVRFDASVVTAAMFLDSLYSRIAEAQHIYQDDRRPGSSR